MRMRLYVRTPTRTWRNDDKQNREQDPQRRRHTTLHVSKMTVLVRFLGTNRLITFLLAMYFLMCNLSKLSSEAQTMTIQQRITVFFLNIFLLQIPHIRKYVRNYLPD